MECDDEASIEAEIQRELDKLTEEDLLKTTDSSTVESTDSDISVAEDVIPEEFDSYLKSLQQQTSAFELDLAECDDLLQKSFEITSSRDVDAFNHELEQIAAEQGENLEEMKLKILEDLEKLDFEEDDKLVDSEDEENIVDDSSSEASKDKAMVLVTSQQIEFKELLAGEKDKVQENYKKQEDQVNQIIEKEKQEEKKFQEEIESKRKEMQLFLEREKSVLHTEREKRKQDEEINRKMIEKQWEEETLKQQEIIHELELKAQKEKQEWEEKLKEEQQKQEEKKEKSATKIQSVYRGYCARKQHKSEVDRKRKEGQEKLIEEKVRQIQEEQRKLEKEEERKRKEEEDKKKIEEQRKIEEEKRQEEERKKREAEEKKKQEEAERKQREKEEKQRKEEEARKKAEEVKQRKEEEKRLKEEEKKRKEEEKRKKKEEEERKKKDELERKKKEELERKEKEELERKKKEEFERKKQEELERKKEEEKKVKIEKERQEKEEEKKKKVEEERKEMERIRQEELRKQEAELSKQEEKLQEFLSDKNLDTNIDNVSSQNKKGPRQQETKSPRKWEKRRKIENNKWMSASIQLDSESEEGMMNGNSSVMGGLPSHVESKRLAWIKSCTPWSKISNEPWKLKMSTSKRPIRRPSSAKKLGMLEESIILMAAKAASLRQVTTVELKDLPGSNISTLGQCTGLQCLKMVNCNLVAVEGLQQCKQLQYLDVKNNKIEYIDLKSLGNIKVIDLSNNMISVIHGMEGCTDVRWLDLSDNKITRLGGLNGLRRLHTLKLSRNQLINTCDLGDTPTIQHLDLSHNHLQEVDDLNKLCLLQILNLSSNNLGQIPDLHNHVLLQELDLNDNNIETLDKLNECWLPLVQKLNASQNSVEDLVRLENLLLLRELDLSNNQVTDIDVCSLQSCHYLEVLQLNGNPAIESVEDSFRKKLTETLSRLHVLDDTELKSSDYGSPVKPRNSFEALCLHQVQMMRDLYNRFQQDLKSLSCTVNLHEMCDLYFKFCDKTQKMAEDHRYSHEYGDVTIKTPTAPSTPKSGRPRSARANKMLQDSYMSPKEMFERALQNGGGNSSKCNGLVRGDNVAVVKPVVSAKTVQDILEDDSVIQKKNEGREKAAIKIQSAWRGFTIRRWYQETLQQNSFDLSVFQELHNAAVKIQAVWRGYSLRCRLERAIEFAKLDDDEEFGEIDLGDFNFDQDILDDWKPPSTPQIPNSHPVLGKPPSGKKNTPPKVPNLYLEEHPHPPQQPRKAWRGMDSPASEVHHPRPPSSLVSGSDTHRTALSKKEEKISEEWGFKDNQTAHLMLQRAKKMKYNAERRKKLRKLDPKQRLLLYRKLEETAHYPHVQPPNRKILPRKEYFQERQKEIESAERQKRIEKNEKISRTFEWLHTQVGDFEISDSCINSNIPGNRARNKYGSDGNLPKLDSDLMSGKPVRLVSSPVDLQSVDSVSLQGELAKPRRFSAGSNDSHARLPPIKGGSAPTGQKKERISWRNPQKNTDIGWGGGKKRVVH